MRWWAIGSLLSIFYFSGIGLGHPQSTPTQASSETYDAKFFQVLQVLFDTFRDTDLQRSFQAAPPIGCSELLGDWRTAAFFNENRNLERWFYKTIEEVQADLSRYIFQGKCSSESADVQVASRFPVRDSMEAYNKGQIEFDRITFRINAPVGAKFDSKARVYAFDLPYLYVTGRNGSNTTYSMMPPDAAAKYVQEVTNRWECKAVKNTDITYRFLLCRTTILPRNPALRSQSEDRERGTSAYVLLTDGREARASVTLAFPTSTPRRDPSTLSRIADLNREDFRLLFANPSWESRIFSAAILSEGRFVAESARELEKDSCEWRPQSPAVNVLLDVTDKSILFYLTRADRSESSPAVYNFDTRTASNSRLGLLRCTFPGTASAANIDMNRLLSILGDHIKVEFR